MKSKKIYLSTFLIILSLMASCSKPKNPIEGFNAELWKEDKKSCLGKRTYLAEIVLNNSLKLKGMDDDDVAELLGKPEKTNYEERGKKTYFYYIQQGSQCDDKLMLEGSQLAIEFDALGRLKLITERKF